MLSAIGVEARDAHPAILRKVLGGGRRDHPPLRLLPLLGPFRRPQEGPLPIAHTCEGACQGPSAKGPGESASPPAPHPCTSDSPSGVRGGDPLRAPQRPGALRVAIPAPALSLSRSLPLPSFLDEG